MSFTKATSIGYRAFSGCTGLTAVSLPEAVSIGIAAFSGCTSLESASLPRVTSIGDYAFQQAFGSGGTITMGSTAPTVGLLLFRNTDSPQTITVRVPTTRAGYDDNWRNNFKGGNGNITIKVE